MVQKLLIDVAIKRPRLVILLSVLVTLLFLAAFPSLTTDTDPEHMLPHDNPAIQLYEHVKTQFDINDMVVVGINSKDGSSLFTPDKLDRIDKIIKEILEIRDQAPEETAFMQFFRKLQFLKSSVGVETSPDIFDHSDVFSISTLDDIVLTKSGGIVTFSINGVRA